MHWSRVNSGIQGSGSGSASDWNLPIWSSIRFLAEDRLGISQSSSTPLIFCFNLAPCLIAPLSVSRVLSSATSKTLPTDLIAGPVACGTHVSRTRCTTKRFDRSLSTHAAYTTAVQASPILVAAQSDGIDRHLARQSNLVCPGPGVDRSDAGANTHKQLRLC